MNKRTNGYLFPKAGSKKARILNDLINGHDLTPLKAMAYGTMRLAAVIHELRNLNGFTIATTYREDNAGVLFAEYRMPEGERSRVIEALECVVAA